MSKDKKEKNVSGDSLDDFIKRFENKSFSSRERNTQSTPRVDSKISPSPNTNLAGVSYLGLKATPRNTDKPIKRPDSAIGKVGYGRYQEFIKQKYEKKLQEEIGR